MKKHGTKIIGSTQRVYIIAEGAGADFASQYLASEKIEKFFVYTTFQYVPTAMLLFNTSNENVTCTCGMPVSIVNSIESVTSAFTKINQGIDNAIVLSDNYKTEELNAEIVMDAWNNLFSGVRRQITASDCYELIAIPNYAEYNLTVNHQSAPINGKALEWDEYIPEAIDVDSSNKFPLVLTFHGGGNHAEYQAYASGWLIIASEENFMVVAVNQHVDRTAEEIVELINILTEKYSGIDTSRIYASGFSMGAIKSWQLGQQYPELFAGIAPMDAVQEAPKEIKDVVIPTFYVAGEEDGLLVFPHQQSFDATEEAPGNGDFTIETILNMNNIEYKGFGKKLNQFWGMKFDNTYTVTSENKNHVVTVNTLKSKDGNTYTAFANTSKQSHSVLEVNSRVAWDFLRQFSRNTQDNTIAISK